MSVRARECCAPDERLQALRRMLDDYQRRGRGGGSLRFVPTGVAELDRRLPHGGLPGGAITEIISPVEGVGATTLTMRTALAALSPASNAGACGIVGGDDSRTVVVVDARGDLYPPAIWAMGIRPDRLLVVRAARPADACWAVDQCLRCSAVGAVVAWVNRLDAAASRRLQLAAESGEAIGLLLRGGDTARQRSFAAVRMLIEPAPAAVAEDAGGSRHAREGPRSHRAPARLCRITLVKVREGMPIEPFVVNLDETGHRPVLPVPAHRSAAVEHRRVSA